MRPQRIDELFHAMHDDWNGRYYAVQRTREDECEYYVGDELQQILDRFRRAIGDFDTTILDVNPHLECELNIGNTDVLDAFLNVFCMSAT